MLRFALRSLIADRRRAATTGLAVVVGVSMVTGRFIFTDTINSAFRQLFSHASKGAAVVVSSRQDITSSITSPASLPTSLISKIRRLPGVATAQGQISDVATIVGHNGRIVKSTGLPTLALSYLAPPFDGLTFAAGTPPRGPDQVAIDTGTATRQGYRVGDLVPIVTAEPVRRFRISGIASLGLPSAAIVLQLRTVILGLAVGVLVTLGAGLFPALRAMRAAPLESLREAEATAAQGDSSKWLRSGVAAVLGVGGLLVIFTGSGTATERLTQSAVGAVALVLAILVASAAGQASRGRRLLADRAQRRHRQPTRTRERGT